MALFAVQKLAIGLASIVAYLVLYFIFRCIYNVSFHHLARIPGPKLAAASGWYEVYFDCFKSQGGQYIHEIDRQHEHYGPIIRINPREVHIRDVAFRESLYSRNRRVDKDAQYAAMFGLPLSLFGTEIHERHRMRRAALNPFFSKASVVRLEPLFQRHVRSLCDTLSQIGKEGTVIQLRNAMIAVTLDIISEYAFGEPVGASKSPESWPRWEAMMSGVAEGVPAAKSFPWLMNVMLKMPLSIIKILAPVFGDYFEYMGVIRGRVRKAIDAHQSAVTKPEAHATSWGYPDATNEQPTIYTEVLKSILPTVEKSEDRLTQEGVGFVAAGSETTALTIGKIMFHVIQQRETVRSIREELRTVMPTRHKSAQWTQLELLPMLSAVVKEGLRISVSIGGRLPVVLDAALHYKGHVIPPRTPISMSPRHALMDPEIFDEPTRFDPRRWIDADPVHRSLMDRALVPFNQGPRMCVGLNLAYAEIYHNLSCMLARFEFDLVETVRERDVDLCRDCFVSKSRQGSKGTRVRIVQEFGEQW